MAPAPRNLVTASASSSAIRSLNKLLAAGSGKAGDINNVFEANGDAMQRTAPKAALYFAFGLPRLRQCRFPSDGDKGIEYRILLGDSPQTFLRKFDRRDFALTQTLGYFKDGIGQTSLRFRRPRPAFCKLLYLLHYPW